MASRGVSQRIRPLRRRLGVTQRPKERFAEPCVESATSRGKREAVDFGEEGLTSK